MNIGERVWEACEDDVWRETRRSSNGKCHEEIPHEKLCKTLLINHEKEISFFFCFPLSSLNFDVINEPSCRKCARSLNRTEMKQHVKRIIKMLLKALNIHRSLSAEEGANGIMPSDNDILHTVRKITRSA